VLVRLRGVAGCDAQAQAHRLFRPVGLADSAAVAVPTALGLGVARAIVRRMGRLANPSECQKEQGQEGAGAGRWLARLLTLLQNKKIISAIQHNNNNYTTQLKHNIKQLKTH